MNLNRYRVGSYSWGTLFIVFLAITGIPREEAHAATVAKTALDPLQAATEKAAIIETINQYAFTIDNRNLEAFYALFTEDSLWAQTIPTRDEPIEYLQPRSALEARFNGIFKSPQMAKVPVGVNSFHVQSGTVFLELDPEYAKTVTQAVIYTQQFEDDGSPMDGFTWRAHNTVQASFVGVYHDVLVKKGGRWLFKERIFHASNNKPEQAPQAISSIRTIGLCVTDLKRSRKFYQHTFGFRPAPNTIKAGSGADGLLGLEGVDMTVHLLEKNGLNLELLEYRHPAAVDRGEPVMNSLGLTHLGLYVSDLHKVLKDVKRLGGNIVESSRIAIEGKTLNIRVADPDGNQIVLYTQ